jgi:hypothetical protein
MDTGRTRRADGLAHHRHRVRSRRPPRRPATRIHCQGGPATGRHLRRLRMAAHHAVRQLRWAPADRVRLPGMRSPAPDIKPGTGRSHAAVRNRRFLIYQEQAFAPGWHRINIRPAHRGLSTTWRCKAQPTARSSLDNCALSRRYGRPTGLRDRCR